MAQNPNAVEDVDNEVLREADDYLRKHKILELFEVSFLYSFYKPLYRTSLPSWLTSSRKTSTPS